MRVVLVTGAAKRLGREIALACSKAGWQVAIHHRNSLAEAQETCKQCEAIDSSSGLSVRAKSYQSDLSKREQIQNLLDAVIQDFKQLDAVVNSAAVFEFDDIETFSGENFDTHLNTNTLAPVLLSQGLFKHLKARDGHGVVVNMLDQKLWNLNPDFLSYTLSKATLKAATDVLARAMAPTLRVVGVAPGLTLTSHMMSEETFEELHKLSPLGRSSTPHDVAQTVVFALDNQSITGSTLIVDGGQHMQPMARDFSMM